MDASKTGKLIARVRKEQGKTQGQLASELGISSAAVSKWERGIGFPDASLIEALAVSLHITIEELYAGERKCTKREDVDEVGIDIAEGKWLNFLFTFILFIIISIVTEKWWLTWGIWLVFGIYQKQGREKKIDNRTRIIGKHSKNDTLHKNI